jgi:hypothetical protein
MFMNRTLSFLGMALMGRDQDECAERRISTGLKFGQPHPAHYHCV